MSLLLGPDIKNRGVIPSFHRLGVMSSPVMLGDGAYESFSASSISHGSISPSADALILVHWNYRNTSFETLLSLAAGFNLSSGFTLINEDKHSEGSVYVHTAAYWGITTSSPGSGTVVATFSDATTHRTLEVYQIATGFLASSPIRQSTKSI